MSPASASDAVGITSVQFQLGGVNLGAPIITAPYTVSWDSTTAVSGSYSLTAIATDAAGNSATSTPISVTVDNSAPTVSVTAPVNGASVSGTVTVSATASDNVGVTSVQFQVDGANLGAPVTAAPYTISWDTTASLGSHSLTAVALDATGNYTTAAPISVTVIDIAPVANNGSLTMNTGAVGNGILSVTLGYPMQAVTFAVGTTPTHGTLTITNAATGAFTYTSSPGYVGTDGFTFMVTDSDGAVSNTATENFTVKDVAATAVNGNKNVNPILTATGSLAATLAYPSQTLTYSVVTGPSHGILSITNAATGAFSYTQNVCASTPFNASDDSFTFKVTDSLGTVSNVATENITIFGAAGCLSTTFFGFEPRLIGTQSAPRSVTLTDYGVAPLTGISVSDTGNVGQFVITGDCGTSVTTLNPGQSCSITTTYEPSFAGDVAITVSVSDNGAGNGQSFVVDGTGLSALASLTPSTGLNFGSVSRGHSATLNATLTNSGTGELGISSITTTGIFGVSSQNCGSSLAAGSSCTITVKFSPTANSSFGGNLIVNDATTSDSVTQSISLTGSGTGF